MVIAAAALFVVAAWAQQAPVRGLTAAPQVALVYDAIFDARFDEVPALLTRACALRAPQGAQPVSRDGQVPNEACQLLEAIAVWWEIQLDPLNTRLDSAFESRVAAAVAAAEGWTIREPQRAEAWFYLGGAYGARVQMRVLRGAQVAAARDGIRIKNALERALALDPDMADAYFGIGLYHYYAAVAPAAVRMLRRLLLLPGGDRAGGLVEMQKARARGLISRDEADYQLHVIDVWYEKQPRRALGYLDGLIARHPRNPHFRQAAAEILDFYIDDTAASLRAWQALLDAARRKDVAAPAIAEVSARLGVASQLDQSNQSEAALEHLHAVIAARPTAPVGALARAHLQRGDALEHLGQRAEAAEAYRTAIAAAGARDPHGIAARARAALRAQR
jgi:tetratricopeptide (TPR) repeat protein